MSEQNRGNSGSGGITRIIAIVLIILIAVGACLIFKKKAAPDSPVQSVLKGSPPQLQRVDLTKPERFPSFKPAPRAGGNALGPRLSIPLNGHVTLAMVKVDRSRFILGKHDNESSASDREYPVVLKSNYYIGKYEVSQAQYEAVMGDNPSLEKNPEKPVDRVSWQDAMLFCQKLNQTGKAPAGWMFTLPTEAQWEFAARGGIFSQGFKYSGGNHLDEVGWYDRNSGETLHPVGKKKANELGLFDMSGNVSEYCLDDFNINRTGFSAEFVRTDLQSNAERVVRGGSCGFEATHCRLAARTYASPDEKRAAQGFRVVLVKIEEKTAESHETDTPPQSFR